MKITKKQVDSIIREAQDRLSINDWQIEWEYGTCEYEADIYFRYTEKYARVTVDKSKITDEQNLRRSIYHELVHPLFGIIERGLDDFVVTFIKDKKTRDLFWERLNTDQNILIDHLVAQVLKI